MTDFSSFFKLINNNKNVENMLFYINLINQLIAENNIKMVYLIIVLKIMSVDLIIFKKTILR